MKCMACDYDNEMQAYINDGKIKTLASIPVTSVNREAKPFILFAYPWFEGQDRIKREIFMCPYCSTLQGKVMEI